MLVVTEDLIDALVASGDREAIYSAYNAQDCATTREVWDTLTGRLDADTGRIYRFEHACQQVALAMTLRGVLIDPSRRAAAIEFHEKEEADAQRIAGELAGEAWTAKEKRVGQCSPGPDYAPTSLETRAGHSPGDTYRMHAWPRGVSDEDATCRRCGLGRLRPAPINTNSWQQVQRLLYGTWGVYRRYNRDGGVTSDNEALESIENEYAKKAQKCKPGKAQDQHQRVADFARQVILARKARKQIGYARSQVGPDGRMRSGTNVGATETGRWSCSQAPDWTGWNIQQISDRLRHMVVADPGLEIFYADLEQAESHVVAYDAGDEAYIQAHLTGDVHTQVCRMIYQDIPWTGDLAADKALAETYFDWDPHHTKRDHMKRVQHGGNMGRSPAGIARQLHIPVKEAEKFFDLMYGPEGAFPMIKARHREIHAELQRTGVTTSVFGRRRQFLGRLWEDETLREALGQLEQSPVADILNLALLRIWLEMDTRLNIHDAPHPSQPNRVWLLAQVHDAILGLRRTGDDEALRRVKELMTIPFEIRGRICTIPVEIAVGPSWSKKEMRKWNPK